MTELKQISVKLPDGTELKTTAESTVVDIAKTIGPRLAKAAVAGKLNGVLVDLSARVADGDAVEIITGDTPIGLDILRHSTAHLLAQAVGELFSDVQFGIGPNIEDGFYYDFDLPTSLSVDDLPKIEAKMVELAAKAESFERQELSRAETLKMFKASDQPYKIELVEELEDPLLSVYRLNGFTDLCRGPHLPNTERIKAFKLLKVAGAYWRGNENRPMLQRIYGTAFTKKTDLDQYLHRLEEAGRRDHRVLGKQLDLFHIDESIGPGLPLWHPKGAMLRKTIEDYWEAVHLANGYELVVIPHIARVGLWKTSGHWDFYRENMYSPMKVDSQEYIVKPMNCPMHMQIYKSQPRSYRDLPLRWAELGTVYRYERSGVLHGLLRVRGFTQDDAHIFCEPDQLLDEIKGVISLVQKMLPTFGFTEFDIYLSTRPQKFVGSPDKWELATGALETALKECNLDYQIDPGEGVFYGPKIDIKIKDALGRSWQCTTIQVDFNLPERFDITYKGVDNKDHQPIMIHRAILGSLERFIGCLIEHYGGAFPLWLAPSQVVVIPIADRHLDYAGEVKQRLLEVGLRASVDNRPETVNRKIRDNQMQRIPYMLVVGDREVKSATAAVRLRDGTDIGDKELDDIVAQIKEEAESRSIET
ncbi:MAG TPA: threonine--tRNA ligase, partial [Actinobacteria bacterium]|nr:threonine--tRNA ligase [Actinomycetota bacterium]